ncbi:MAG: peptide ABC transporter permease [Candidatus Fraserbacteria bacterium RBG_16_55_9]|uniref:Peptide ABC transporter permease n=1 Tax=Fraserbacteria sp. (strain RBG_16_55_9) TaxID=1817864 RepID=A0A1F5URQ0_FRAXR|nr:MAG: peptide ABC transporter permease [Candidatus Fraserbacteria bacterium RBG_16_55_9]
MRATRDTLLQLLKNPLSTVGLFLLVIFATVALFAPLLAPPERPNAPYQIPQREIVRPFQAPQGKDVYETTPTPPSANHILGTTQDYYDIYYTLIWGARNAFKLGILIVLSTLMIGVVVGAVSAYFGGWVDEILMRIVEIFLVFPFLLATLVLTTILGRGLDKIVIAFIVFGWPGYARFVRGEVLHVKENAYVEAARAAGAGSRRVIFRHVLPNAIYPVLVLASLDIGSIVLSASALSFLGLIPEGFADWGQLIGFSRNWILGTVQNPLEYWYTIIFPGLAISLFVLGWNLLGDAVRDIFDPRLRGSRSRSS